MAAVLTDYHVHLRADDDDRPPERSAFTAENVERYLAAAAGGGDRRSWAAPSTSTGSAAALEIWRHPFWEEQARDDLDAYCEFVRTTPLRLGLEVDFVPGAEDRSRNLLDAPRLRLRGRLGPLRGRSGGGPRGLRHLGAGRRPRRGLAPLLRDAGRGGALRPVRHPGPPRPGEDVGARPGPIRSAIRASTTSRPWRRSPSPALRSRSRPPACESRSRRCIPRRPWPPCAWRPGPRSASPPTRTCPPTSATLRERRGGDARLGDRADRRVRAPRAPAGAARMSRRGGSAVSARVGIGYDAHRFAAGRRLVLGGVEIPHERRPGGPFRRRRPHPRRDRRAAGGGRAGGPRHAVPPEDERWRDAHSLDLLTVTLGNLHGRVVNVDATLICEAPRLGRPPRRDGAEPRPKRCRRP